MFNLSPNIDLIKEVVKYFLSKDKSTFLRKYFDLEMGDRPYVLSFCVDENLTKMCLDDAKMILREELTQDLKNLKSYVRDDNFREVFPILSKVDRILISEINLAN